MMYKKVSLFIPWRNIHIKKGLKNAIMVKRRYL
nr:MAG TPA: hypothetical protein [Caudoviricetes sp.]